MTQSEQKSAAAEALDAVIVGAGFAGMYMLHRLRGLGMTVRIFEAAGGVGGTWYWNRYPGARCDVESMQYSYSFSDDLQQDWTWSELFAGQPEILRYANHVAERFDLRRDIRFDTRVTSAVFDEADGRWSIGTDRGEVVTARFCVMATGCLSSAKLPEIPGIETFRGNTYHTGQWPHAGVDFTGRTVGVIGTGSSAIQSIPVIAAGARHVTVFQRTPNFSIPSRNGAMTEDYARSWKNDYPAKRQRAREMRTGIVYPINDASALAVSPEERTREYEARWQEGGTAFMASFNDIITDKQANDTARDFVHAKIRGIVKNQAVAEMLLPTNHPIGTKRICVDTDYYEAFNRANVTLVDVHAQPIAVITPDGLTAGGEAFAFDDLVFATGFDAMTGALLNMDIRGRDGLKLAAKWADGPITNLGLMTAGFPNLFMITGPGSPSVLSNMMVSIEQHVGWITDCLAYLSARGLGVIEATAEAEQNWVDHVNEVANRTLYPLANSWYMGANVPGKPQVFMPYIGGVGVYRQTCSDIAAQGYTGFRLTTPERTAEAAD